MEVPVYLITGFLESGKTSFIRGVMEDAEFSQGERTLLIVCEEGIEEYDKKLLRSANANADMVVVEEEAQLTPVYLQQLQNKYMPERVLIEFNGTWNSAAFLEMKLPSLWLMYQVICQIDASTFEVYLNNMRSIMMEMIKTADTVVFNRCTAETPRNSFRRTIKAVNRPASLVFESEQGVMDDPQDEELPFDINADIVEIDDDDFGLWYMDVTEFPDKYVGKTIRFKGMVYKSTRLPRGYFVPGRIAMVCCANDAQMIGFLCKTDNPAQLKKNSWVMVTAQLKLEASPAYKGKTGPVLYASDIQPAEKPEEEIAYFS